MKRGEVLRQFGRALGLVPEHEQPGTELVWDVVALRRSFIGVPHLLTADMVRPGARLAGG